MSIALAVWGREFVERFLEMPLASHVAALAAFGGDVRYLLYTDDDSLAGEITRATGRVVERRPLKRFKGYYSMLLNAHQDALLLARGDVVIPLNADNVVSVETFTAIRRRIDEGRKLVMCASTRTDPRSYAPRASADLLRWSAQNMHPITRELIWGEGRSAHPSLLYFRRGESMVVRGFHLHPIAVVADQAFKIEKSIDWNLGDILPRSEIHVVCDPHELALAEISPPSKSMPTQRFRYSMQDVLMWATGMARPMHWWFASHSIRICGDADCGDAEVFRELSERHGHR